MLFRLHFDHGDPYVLCKLVWDDETGPEFLNLADGGHISDKPTEITIEVTTQVE